MTGAPDLAAAVVAFRSWRLAGERLMSPFIPCRWEDRLMHATCFDANRRLTRGVGWLAEPHDSPHEACRCGIYAYHTPGPRSWFGEAYWCEGVVSAWGRLVVHNDGFRAAHARVEALAVPGGLPRFGAEHVHRAAAALGVPVVPHDELERFAAGLGGGVPAALRPVDGADDRRRVVGRATRRIRHPRPRREGAVSMGSRTRRLFPVIAASAVVAGGLATLALAAGPGGWGTSGCAQTGATR